MCSSPADGAPQRDLVRSSSGNDGAGGLLQVGPAPRPGVDVFEIEPGLVEIPVEIDLGVVSPQRSEFVDLGRPLRRDGVAKAPQDDV